MSGFSAGFIKGLVVSALVAGAVSIAVPLDPADPGNKTQVELETPAGSGFNTGRDDSDPVLPRTDQTVASQNEISEPQLTDDSQTTPVADTNSAAQPGSQAGIEMPQVDPGDEEIALVTPSVDETRVTLPAALGVPMPEIDNPVADIPVNELPTISEPVTEIEEPVVEVPTETPVTEDVAVVEETETLIPPTPDEAAVEAQPEEQSALLRNMVAFENPAQRPLMSIILVDAGQDSLDRAALSTMTFPVTFAVDLADPSARQISEIYAKNGFEVAAMAPSGDAALEAAENPSDMVALVDSLLEGMPRAVGLVDEVSAGLQQSSELADQVIAAVQASGHGLVTYDIGLNATHKKARQAGVKSAIVFRIIDGDSENATVIKRYLDRAALEAGKDGHVIILGHTYPETVTALFSWALSPKSSSVVLAPLSASLLSR